MAQQTKTSSSRTRRRTTGNGAAGGDNRDKEMYRRAAEDALQQLDWAIGYLHGIRKTDISKALARNRSYIRKRMLGEPEERLPSEQTDET